MKRASNSSSYPVSTALELLKTRELRSSWPLLNICPPPTPEEQAAIQELKQYNPDGYIPIDIARLTKPYLYFYSILIKVR